MGDIPDLYADQFTMAMTAYGLTLNFAKTPSMPSPGGQNVNEPVAIIRMSLEHAKVMAMLLRRQIKQYELETLGDPVNIPRNVLQNMKLTLEDW